jgi:hypothetical protein
MVRLVFRPYTQVWQMICTSITLRASTRVSSGFTLLTCSSPSFGSYHICSFSSPSSENQDWMHLPPCGFDACSRFLYAIRFLHPITCIWDRLLGPCFKTGRIKSSWQNLHTESSTSISVLARRSSCPGHLLTLFQIPKFILPLACGKCLIVRYRPYNKPYKVLNNTATGQYKQRSHTNDCPSSASDSTISSLLTLFSKFFSSFLRSTCSLSVSHKYLALEEVYLPFRPAVPN